MLTDKRHLKFVTLLSLLLLFMVFVSTNYDYDYHKLSERLNSKFTERVAALYPWPVEKLELLPGEEEKLSFLNYLGDDCAKALEMKNHETRLTEVVSKAYMESNRQLEQTIQRRGRNPVGHSNQAEINRLIYWKVANRSSVKTICEIGFNMGHSTLIWIQANPGAKIYSFDLGDQRNTRYYADYIQRQFPGRVELIWGDSSVTVPRFANTHPDVKCDLLIVDGGHKFKYAYTDLYNMRVMTNPRFHLVMMDDTPVAIMDVVRAWGKAKQLGFLKPLLQCAYWFLADGTPRRGVSIGQYIHTHDGNPGANVNRPAAYND